MIFVNEVTINEERVMIGSINGEKFNVPFNTNVWSNLVDLAAKATLVNTVGEYNAIMDTAASLLEDNRSSEVETACPDIVLVKGKFFLKLSDGTKDKNEIPAKLANKIVESVEKGLSATPLIKAWVRFLRNPNFSKAKANLFASYVTAMIIDQVERTRLIDEEGFAEEVATMMATYNEVAITQEGLIACRKYAELSDKKWMIDPETNEAVKVDRYEKVKTVDEESGAVTVDVQYPDFAEEMTYLPPIMGTSSDAFFCGEKLGHIMKVGNRISLPSWDMVNCNDDRWGTNGLHVGGLSYVQGYSGQFNHLLECFVSPEDIGAIVDVERGRDGAIRVKSYFVYGAVNKPNKGLFHSSTYAALLDGEWEEYKKEAIARAAESLTSAKQA